jgi:acyl-CoA reductase-like NAD-dependent aldehyde dehydrogenase
VRYKLTSESFIIHTSDGVYIPVDPANSEYQKYLQWVSKGNTPDPVDPPTPEELAVAAQAAKDLADRQETQADAKFRSLTSKSPAQVKAWVRNRFPTLTVPEQDDLATVVQVVGVLARRL